MTNKKVKHTVSCVIYVNDKFVLINEKQNDIYKWDIPAGSVEKGETLVAAIKREIKEEIGLVCNAAPEFVNEFKYTIDSYEVVNSMFKLNITKDDFRSLEIRERNILEIKLFNKKQIKELLDKNNVEHELAKSRLLYILEN